MRLNLKTTNMSVGSDVKEYLRKKLRSLERTLDFDDPSVMVDVELGRTTRHHEKGDVFFAEINIHRGKESFRAVADWSDIMSAIDGMRDAVARELQSAKGKKFSLTRRSGQLVKELLRSGYAGVEYSAGFLGRPARAGWKYLKNFRLWRK